MWCQTGCVVPFNVKDVRNTPTCHVTEAAVNSDNVESIRQGLKMIIAEFNKAFDTLGVTAIDAVGKPFDPELHEAVAHEPSASVPEGVVIKQWSSGFKMGGKLLRPARVVVSSGPAAEGTEG